MCYGTEFFIVIKIFTMFGGGGHDPADPLVPRVKQLLISGTKQEKIIGEAEQNCYINLTLLQSLTIEKKHISLK